MSEREPWPLEPMTEEERSGLVDAVAAFVKAAVGGGLTLFGVGALILPNLVEARGATRSWVLQKERRARCLELGLTPEQLDALERGDAERPPEAR